MLQTWLYSTYELLQDSDAFLSLTHCDKNETIEDLSFAFDAEYEFAHFGDELRVSDLTSAPSVHRKVAL